MISGGCPGQRRGSRNKFPFNVKLELRHDDGLSMNGEKKEN